LEKSIHKFEKRCLQFFKKSTILKIFMNLERCSCECSCIRNSIPDFKTVHQIENVHKIENDINLKKGKYKIQKKKERNMMQVRGDETNQEEYGERHLSNKPNRPAQNYRSGVSAEGQCQVDTIHVER
jgi:hypothetical protein